MTTDVAAPPAASQAAAEFQPLQGAYRSYAMSLLLAFYIVNFVDRQVINILAEPIKRDLDLADWQLGVMTGLAFAGVYTFLGIPVARLSERRDRPIIIAASIAIWSGFTGLCGLAQNFSQLVLARFGVGVGQSGATPAAHSLIVDYVPPEKRSSALAFYGLGGPLGGLLGMAFGGLIADAYGWRVAFLLAGAPGLVLAILALTTLREPRRAIAARAARAEAASATFGETMRLMGSKRSYCFLVCAMAIATLISYGGVAFLASFYLRNHADQVAATASALGAALGFDLGSVGFLGIAIGLMAGVSGAVGMWCGGQLADRFAPSDPRRYMYGPAIVTVMSGAAFICAMLAPSLGLSLALFALSSVFAAAWYGPAYTAAYSVVPAHMRATNSAIILFAGNMIGLGLGPVAVGALSDLISASLGPAEGMRWALIVFSGITLLAAGLFWTGARTIREDTVS